MADSPGSTVEELAVANERLRLANANMRMAAKMVPDWPLEGEKLTMGSVAGQMRRLAESEKKMENMMEAALGSLGVTVDEAGTVQRGPPPMSSGIADQMGLMETFGMRPDQIQYARQVFELYDRDVSGTMDATECMDALRYLGEDPTMEQVEAIIAAVDKNENGDLDLSEFFQVYAQIAQRQEADEEKPVVKMSQYGVMALMRWVHHDGANAIARKSSQVETDDEAGKPRVIVAAHRRVARSAVMHADSEVVFQLSIAVSAVCSGIATYGKYDDNNMLYLLGSISTMVFVIEVALKFVAESQTCASIKGYFSDHWNTFDVIILSSMVVGEIIKLSGQDGVIDVRVLRIFRFLRALRVLRAAKMLPQLALVMETLLRSASAVGYIAGFMLLIAYIFAVIGVTIFKHNDPFHFGTLDRALVSLFRVVTLEDWTDIMYFNSYGCEGWADYSRVIQHNGTSVVAETTPPCRHESFSFASVMYFLIYILISAFLVLNLFIGVIVKNMTDMAREFEEKQVEMKAWAVATRLKDHGAKGKKVGKAALREGLKAGNKLGGKLSKLTSKVAAGADTLYSKTTAATTAATTAISPRKGKRRDRADGSETPESDGAESPMAEGAPEPSSFDSDRHTE